jgi:hypothetical protein
MAARLGSHRKPPNDDLAKPISSFARTPTITSLATEHERGEALCQPTSTERPVSALRCYPTSNSFRVAQLSFQHERAEGSLGGQTEASRRCQTRQSGQDLGSAFLFSWKI